MKAQDIQNQYDKIYSYFRTTCEPFDYVEFDGCVLQVWNNGVLVEKYSLKDLKEIIF